MLPPTEFDRFRALIEALPVKTKYTENELLTDRFLALQRQRTGVCYIRFHYLNHDARWFLWD